LERRICMKYKLPIICAVILVPMLACSTLTGGTSAPTDKPAKPTLTPGKLKPPAAIPDAGEEDSAPLPSIPDVPDISDFTDMYNMIPTGEPAKEWKEIPVMPAATSGEETDNQTYNYAVPVDVDQVVDFYVDRLSADGWSELIPLVQDAGLAVLTYIRSSDTVVITIFRAPDGLSLVSIFRG
jgi:hypothetical protein